MASQVLVQRGGPGGTQDLRIRYIYRPLNTAVPNYDGASPTFQQGMYVESIASPGQLPFTFASSQPQEFTIQVCITHGNNTPFQVDFHLDTNGVITQFWTDKSTRNNDNTVIELTNGNLVIMLPPDVNLTSASGETLL